MYASSGMKLSPACMAAMSCSLSMCQQLIVWHVFGISAFAVLHEEMARVKCWIRCFKIFVQASAVVQLVGAQGVSAEYVLGALKPVLLCLCS